MFDGVSGKGKENHGVSWNLLNVVESDVVLVDRWIGLE